jgi:GT2 family glycosyltransferase
MTSVRTTTKPSDTQPTGHTTWALAIATYNRRDVLMQCLKLAAAQTRPPDEILVVDASKDWEASREQVMTELVPKYPNIRWDYHKATRPSAAVQRNQVSDLATSEVVFLFDDDSFMYPDTAEHLMKLYDADVNKEVAGVAAALADKPPAEAADEKATEEIEAARAAPTVKQYSPIAKFVRKVLDADNLFVPYDEGYPGKFIPDSLKGMRVGKRELMAGMTMTARRELICQERFSEILADRSGEDSDVTYRISRHGAIVTALDAKVFHVGSPSGRFSSFSREVFYHMAPMVLHRFYSTDQARSKRESRKLIRRKCLLGLVKDIQAKEWDLPRLKGAWFALRRVDKVFNMTTEEIEAWYPGFQKQVMDGDLLRGKKK